MNNKPQSYCDDLTAWAESSAPAIRPSAVLHQGEQARAASRALIEKATGDDPDGRALVRDATRGRPTLDSATPAGSSPLWQVRAPRSLDQALRDRARSEGRSLSEVIRDAATAYLAAHRSG
ncbi:MAG: ribbon-helix-helix domain-containing protein [Bifidobacteriaceae bacterium]|nr:ribbon-helix-helix domain-containing protein [Bifidobacteriaceae bacterium]